MDDKETKEKKTYQNNNSFETLTDNQLKTPKHNLGQDFLEYDKTENPFLMEHPPPIHKLAASPISSFVH